MQIDDFSLNDYVYHLPDEKIAKHPLKDRSKSKLLFYNKGKIEDQKFELIPEFLPDNAHLVFNNTRVIPARLNFFKETGARIEIFLLEPVAPSTNHEQTMAATGSCTWKVMIGNARKWKKGSPLAIKLNGSPVLTAQREQDDEVTFTWEDPISFSEILSKVGTIPLPPYLNRQATEEDIPRYQTVYSKVEGAVAAPTAGLHFTDKILDELLEKGVSTDYVTLHVSAGTFQPIKAKKVTEHEMHNEQVIISRENVEKLLKNVDRTFAVGTTSMRTLESLYWFGNQLAKEPDSPFFVEKLQPYQAEHTVSVAQSLNSVLDYMKRHHTEILVGHTEIFIFPGYQFKICKGLITNFHLPGSTLILLVAALIGDSWRNVYDFALNNEYRFLSYGDSSLLIP